MAVEEIKRFWRNYGMELLSCPVSLAEIARMPSISAGSEEQKAAAPPKLGRNPFQSGKCFERTIGSSGNFSACYSALSDISGRKFTAP